MGYIIRDMIHGRDEITRCHNTIDRLNADGDLMVFDTKELAEAHIKDEPHVTDINNANLYVPKRELCTDNAAMIAWAGAERYKKNKRNNFNFQPLPHWDI